MSTKSVQHQNTAVLSNFPARVRLTMWNFTMAKRTGAAQNGLPSQMIYVFSLTATVNILNPATPCVQNAKDTIRDLKIPVKNECGYGISPPLRTLIRLHISAFWRLLLHLSLCPAASLTGNWNRSNELPDFLQPHSFWFFVSFGLTLALLCSKSLCFYMPKPNCQVPTLN